MPRWVRTSLKWCLRAILVAVAGTAIVSAVRSFRQVSVTEVNLADASVRTRSQYLVWGVCFVERVATPVATGLTTFLRENVDSRLTGWTSAGQSIRDYRGHELDYYMPHGVGHLLAGAQFRTENLPRVQSIIPGIAEMIRSDILAQEHLGVSTMLMGILRQMCDDPSEENLNRQLEEWNWIKHHPGLFGGA